MNYSLFNFSETILSEIGFALLHTIWQAALIAGIVFLLLRLMANFSSQSRYYVASSGLIVIFLLPLITIWQNLDQTVPLPAANNTGQTDNLIHVIYVLADASFGFNSTIAIVNNYINQFSTHFVWFWFFGMLLMMLRLSGGYMLAYRFKTKHVRPIENQYSGLANMLAKRLGIRRKVTVLESLKVDIPMVIGFIKPAIIMPIGLLARIPYEQAEMILAHELAHIKRADFLINLLQSLVEVLLFFNPFVWWLSTIIRHERENICDDIAISITGKNINLARALVSLSETPQSIPENSFALYFNKFNTMKRIERLFSNPKLKPSNIEKAIVSLMAILAVVVLTTTGSKAGASITGIFDAESSAGPLAESHFNSTPPDTLMPVSSEEKTKKKEIFIELKDGSITKAVIDGHEVPADELEKEDFVIIDKDTTIMKRVEIKGAHPKFKTMVLETNALEWHQKTGDVKAKKIILSTDDAVVLGNPFSTNKYVYEFKDDNGKKFSFDAAWQDSLMWHIPRIDSIEMKEMMDRMRMAHYNFDSIAAFRFQIEPQIDSILNKHGIVSVKGLPIDKDIYFQFIDDNTLQSIDSVEFTKQLALKMELLSKELEAKQFSVDTEALLREIELQRQQLNKRIKEMKIRHMDHDMELEKSIAIKERQHAAQDKDGMLGHEKAMENPDYSRKYLRLLKDELIAEKIASSRSVIVVSNKQTIIDGNVVDNRTHKRLVKRLEEISGKKLEKDQAVTIR